MKTYSVFWPFLGCVAAALGQFALTQSAGGAVVTNRPAADTTLFEAFPTNNLGASDLTSGSTLAVARSRALVRFDLQTALPADAAIQSAVLILTVTRQPTEGVNSNYRLFRLLQPWVEGDKGGVHGAPAAPGQTTWSERLAGQSAGQWSAPGAASPDDYLPVPSAAATVDNGGHLQFASSNLVADAQFWLAQPTNNYGWILISDAEDLPQTVTHFGSREDPTNAPILILAYASASSDSELRIRQFAKTTNTFTIGFDAVAGTSYVIESSSALTTTNWQTLLAIPAPASDTNLVIGDPIVLPQRFYRLRADQQPNMAYIPSGAFMMGSPTNELDRFGDEGPQVAVTISAGFWIGRYPVTQAEYESVTGSNPSHFTGDPRLPVEQVSWFEATNYCHQLTEQAQAAGRIPDNYSYRLPTEAEWEYACRASTTTRFSYGDDIGYLSLADYAWYSANSDSRTHPVGQKLPNPWGLYDMHGDVLQWCQDWWGKYSGGAALDPQGPSAGSLRVIRGGSWLRIPEHCRSAFRHGFTPDAKNILIGLRVVLAPDRS